MLLQKHFDKKKVKGSGALTMFGKEYVVHNRFCTFHFPFSFQIPLVAFQIPFGCKLTFLQSEKEARLEQFPTRNS